MKNCTFCKHADWEKTKSGRLHPSGDGVCTYQWKMPPIPASMFWVGVSHPFGGSINRNKELNEHCAYYARGER